MRYKKYVNTVVFLFILYLSFPFFYNPFSTAEMPVTVDVISKRDPLYEKINKIAVSGEYNQEAEDAYIDRVWKKTPGRVGREVNVEHSYEQMKESGVFEEQFLVFNDVLPKVLLADLPAAPIYRGHPEKMMVTLLINVSWGTEYVPTILEVLKEKNVKANFFIEGKWARNNPELVKMVRDEGHLIGNHAYNHPDMARIATEEIQKQIEQTNEIMMAIIDESPQYFAPPSGSYTDEVVEIAHELKMETILWTTDTGDWKNPTVSVMINRVNNNLHPGATILMHPTAVIANGLGELIDLIEAEDYRIGRLDQLLSEKR